MFAMQNIVFKKIPTLRIKEYYFHFTGGPTLFFSVLPVAQKIDLVLSSLKYLSGFAPYGWTNEKQPYLAYVGFAERAI